MDVSSESVGQSHGELLVKLGSIPEYFEKGYRSKRRKVPVEGSRIKKIGNKIWQQFATLYNDQGLKYTIGKRYESRETQGEFLFLMLNAIPDSANHCEISVEGGSFFVKSLKEAKGLNIFLNEFEITNEKMELKFGDLLSLRNKINGKRIAEFLFQEVVLEGQYEKNFDSKEVTDQKMGNFDVPQLEEDSTVHIDEPKKKHCDFTPGLNSLVLHSILRYLEVSDLKNCRLVCSGWHDEATKLMLVKKVFTAFDLFDGYTFPTARNMFFSYVQEMGNLVSNGRFALGLPEKPLSQLHAIERSLASKCFDDIEWFFGGGGFTNPITMLELSLSLEEKEIRDLCVRIFQNCGSNLKELSLCLEFGARLIWITDSQFPYLQDWIHSMAELAPQVKSLQLDLNLSGIEIDAILEMDEDEIPDQPSSLWPCVIAEQLVQVISLGGFPVLTNLHIDGYPGPTMTMLLKLPRKLEMLVLNFTNANDCTLFADDDVNSLFLEDLTLLSTVLEKFSASLKRLKLIDISPWGVDEEFKTVRMPSFPNMKSFEIMGSVQVMFPNGEINYEKDFPVLESLTVHHAFANQHKNLWEEDNELLAGFFPKTSPQICKTLTFLDVNLFAFSMSGPSKPFKGVARLATMFPNVVTCELKRVLEWELEDLEFRKR